MKLSKQLMILIIIISIGYLLLGVYGLQSLKSNLITNRKHEIQSILTFARHQAQHYIDLYDNGKLSRKQAEDKVVDVLSSFRAGTSYIWSNDNHGIARVHVKKSKIGQYQDSYPEHMALLKNADFNFTVGENYKPGSQDMVIKVNGITKLPQWNWVIGYGVYMDDIDATYWHFAGYFLLIAGAIILLVVGLTVLMLKKILRQLGGDPGYAVAVTNRIAQGDLSQTISGKFAKHSLLGSIQIMQQSLQNMVTNIHQGSQQLTEATRDLNTQVSSITQASKSASDASISTSASILEMSNCIKDIALSSEQTEKNSEQASEFCKSGEALVNRSASMTHEIAQQISDSMADFNHLLERSNQIGNVVNVISEIAEQTNLLALNAAIEAARAGEQGRGFAVVADEVRTLASRSASATDEIRETIDLIQQDTDVVAKALQSVLPKVQASVDSSAEVTQMLSEIQKTSTDTLNMIREVSSATSEQEQASQELTRHVENIAGMVRGTAESIDQSRDTVEALDKLANELHSSIGYFTLHDKQNA